MSYLSGARSEMNQRGKSMVGYGADLLEWSVEKNLAVAADIASFAVAQIRLSVEAQDFAEFRSETLDSISGLAETLKEHGQDYVAKLRDVPGEFRDAVAADSEGPGPATRKKAAVKKVA